MPATPPAEIAVDTSLVRKLLQEQHPDLAQLPIQLLDSGWDNYLFCLGDQYIVRLPRRQVAVQLLLNEQKWLPQLQRRLPIPIPAPIREGKPGTDYPWPWSIVPYFEGRSSDLEIPDHTEARGFGRFLKALHIAAPGEAPLNNLRGVRLQQRANTVEERMIRLESKTELITTSIKNSWQQALEAPFYQEAKWLHGDLHARNILVHDGKISGIIDWGDITSGDVATDLASVWMLFSERSAREEAFTAYEHLNEFILQRAKGWAIFFGVVLLDSGLIDDPQLAEIGRRTLERLGEE